MITKIIIKIWIDSTKFVNFGFGVLKPTTEPYFVPYSVVPNKRTVWNNRGGYYIGLFGHYIKNHVLFNKFFWKKSQINRGGGTIIR